MNALNHQVVQFFHNNTPGNTPLVAFFDKGKKHITRSYKITTVIRAIIRAASPKFGFAKANVRSHSLCAGGAMALLLVQVNTNTIHLFGRWQRNTMLHYLHTTTNYFTQGLATRIVQSSTYALIIPAHTAI